MLSCLLGFVPVLLIQPRFSENRSYTIAVYQFGKFQLLEIVCHNYSCSAICAPDRNFQPKLSGNRDSEEGQKIHYLHNTFFLLCLAELLIFFYETLQLFQVSSFGRKLLYLGVTNTYFLRSNSSILEWMGDVGKCCAGVLNWTTGLLQSFVPGLASL